MGGASHISYKPYGEIQRNDSSAPDLFRYKYTGQEEDGETGLYYYKARYYDPLIGRFTQADSVFDTSRPMAMDLYMYTEGNPVRWRDPSGHSLDFPGVVHMFNAIVGNTIHSFNNFLKNPMSSLNEFMHVAEGKGRRSTGDPTLKKADKFVTSSWRILTNPGALLGFIGVLFDFTLGYAYAGLTGQEKPKLHYSNGGIWVENSQWFKVEKPFLGETTSGVTSGPFAFTPEGASMDTVLHEKGHIKQFNRDGLGTLGWNKNSLERHNDYGELTFGYRRFFDYLIFATLIDNNGIIGGPYGFRSGIGPLGNLIIRRYLLLSIITP
ncbi:hypothetical protein DLM75_23775 [Leptospira stimsonii]|uniref:Teneurin-like YD-shell domain-containing protein n=1 Tax=Leptospira stimsonii TaxID=2202203 RepID=A0A396YQK8_9LEPT|nr:RHS repeat-associated core domain-containing protein [Leptospira stimsonii]RHX83638.1 hypothetical protein DLM75_23775 [Leptospira stimsonii]